jgi:hypothetical protein
MSYVPSLRRPWARSGVVSPSKLIDESMDPAEAFRDQKLAKLGDALLNLIYSLSLSQIRGRADGGKIANRVLARAMDESRHRSLVPKGSDKHIRGDLVEAIFAYAWLRGFLDIRECADHLAGGIDADGVRGEEELSVGLAGLIDRILTDLGIPEDA